MARIVPALGFASLVALAATAAPLQGRGGHVDASTASPPPQMREQYGWAPDKAWLDRVQAAAVRLTGGCSASFVSAQGLILTNHHCVASCLADNSTARERSARQRASPPTGAKRERKCPGQQAEVVTKIADVTAEREGARSAARPGEALTKARDAKIAELEKAGCTDTATTRCQVVTPVRRRAVQALHLSQVFRRPPGLGARGPRRDLRRRSRQLQLPALLARCELPARLRKRQAGRDARHLKWNPRAPKEGEVDLRGRQPRFDQPAVDRRASSPSSARCALPITLSRPCRELRGRLIRAMEESPEKAREGLDDAERASRTASRSTSAAPRRSTIPPSPRRWPTTRRTCAPRALATPRSAIRGATSTRR